jgi:hypothetical protein
MPRAIEGPHWDIGKRQRCLITITLSGLAEGHARHGKWKCRTESN